jgi:hypothetical protein
MIIVMCKLLNSSDLKFILNSCQSFLIFALKVKSLYVKKIRCPWGFCQ